MKYVSGGEEVFTVEFKSFLLSFKVAGGLDGKFCIIGFSF
jgi:hypothetical protein